MLQISQLTTLPSEILASIFVNLKDPQISLVCKRFYEINSFVLDRIWNQGTASLQKDEKNRVSVSLLKRMRTIVSIISNKVTVARFKSLSKSQSDELSLCGQVTPLSNEISFSFDDYVQKEKMIDKGWQDIALIRVWGIVSNLIGEAEIQHQPDSNIPDQISSWMKDPQNQDFLDRITSLIIDSQNLHFFPSEIGLLQNVETLCFTTSKLSDLPQEIQSLTNLKELDLRDNKFRKAPQIIMTLTSLKILKFSCNKLSDLPDEMKNLTKLTELNLCGNRFKEIPVVITKLTRLTLLTFSNNKLRDLPEGMKTMNQLKLLNVKHNPVKQIPKALAEMPALHIEGLRPSVKKYADSDGLNTSLTKELYHEFSSLYDNYDNGIFS